MSNDILYKTIITKQFINKIDIPEHLKNEIVIEFQALIEHESLDNILPDDTKKQLEELYTKLNNYDAVIFCARINIRIGKAEGNDYLGSCIYDSYDDFINSDDYINGMVLEALQNCLVDLKSIHTYNTEILKLNDIKWECLK